MTREDLEEIAAVLRDTNIVVISDEIYCELTYGGKQHVCFAELPGIYLMSSRPVRSASMPANWLTVGADMMPNW